MIFIEGLALAGYRSFDERIQYIGPFSKMNLFAGANNCGKSNILRFLKSQLVGLTQRQVPKLDITLDTHTGLGIDRLRFGLGFTVQKLKSDLRLPDDRRVQDCLEACNSCVTKLYPIVGLSFVIHKFGPNGRDIQISDEFLAAAIDAAQNSHASWQFLWNTTTGRSGGGVKEHWILETLDVLSPLRRALPPVALIPDYRRISKDGEFNEELRGSSLVTTLFKLQNPQIDGKSPGAYYQSKAVFQKINEFLREVTGLSKAEMEIPHDCSAIYLKSPSRTLPSLTLPLQSLGTGIYEVVMLAAACTVCSDRIVCIEEPEIHLHPTLQRKLFTYLETKTSNQYFIATHSAHLLDAKSASVFRVTLENDATRVSPAITSKERHNICVDLGIRASDIIQSNCVI